MKLNRVIVSVNKQCDECRKELKSGEIAWVHREKDDETLTEKKFNDCKYYCVDCGEQNVKKNKSLTKLQDKECFADGCNRQIIKERIYYRHKGNKGNFCSLNHVAEVYELYCSCCGRKIAEKDSLITIQAPKTLFQKALPWVLCGLVAVVIIVMIVLIQKNEKRRLKAKE